MRYGTPKISNTDQGSRFTTPRFTGLLEERQICISMDGRERWLDNVLIDRLWRSQKYECVYLHALETALPALADAPEFELEPAEVTELGPVDPEALLFDDVFSSGVVASGRSSG